MTHLDEQHGDGPACLGLPEGRERGTFETWHQFRAVHHGAGAVSMLGETLERLGVRRPLVVTARSLGAASRGPLADVLDALPMAPAAIVTALPHVPFPAAAALAADARRQGVDGVVSLGGGSAIDTGKSVVTMLAGDFSGIADLAARLDARGRLLTPWTSTPVAHVSLPTTLSGAEFTNTIGMTDPSMARKLLVEHDLLSPDTVILDPDLTRLTSPRLWHSTGVKTMSDALEQQSSRIGNPVVDALAVEAVGMFARNLATDGSTPARLACQVATWFAMFGIRSTVVGMGISAALRHQIGASTGAPHGEITCVLLPHVLRYNLPSITGVREIGHALAVHADADGELRVGIGTAVARLLDALDVPRRLRDIGVTERDLDHIARHAFEEPLVAENPRPVGEPSELLQLLREAF